MSSVEVSVVIPCFHQADYVARAIDSCLAQGISGVEVLVVDDGGDPRLQVAVAGYGPLVRLLVQPHGGLSAARNLGLAHARGRFVKFLDADDWLLPGGLACQAGMLRSQGDDTVSLSGFREAHEARPAHFVERYPDFGPLDRALAFCSPLPFHSYLFPTALVRAVGGFSTADYLADGNEDYELLTRLVVRGFQSISTPAPTCVYWRHEGSMSSRPAAIARSRNRVWTAFARTLLLRPTPQGVLADLVAAFTRLVLESALRDEAWDVVESVCGRLLGYPVLSTATAATIATCARAIQSQVAAWPRLASSGESQLAPRAVRKLVECGSLGVGEGPWSSSDEPAAPAREFTLNLALRQRDEDVRRLQSEAQATRARDFVHRFSDTFLIEAPPSLVIYGAGALGGELIRYCRKRRIDVVAVTDSSPTVWGTRIEDLTVISPADCVELECDVWAVASIGSASEIAIAVSDLAARHCRTLRVLTLTE